MSMPPPGSMPPGSNEPPQGPPGGAVPPGYSPPPGGYTPPGGGGGFTPPGGGGGYSPPGGGFTPAGGGFNTGGMGGAPGPLAEWPQRALGGLIDYVGPFIVAAFLFAVTGRWMIYMLLWLLALGWGAYNGYLNGTTGQSIGKKMVGLKVVGEQTGQVIGASMGLVRWAIPAVIGFIPCIGALFLLVDLLFPLWDSKKQTLHDKAVKSLVITVPK